MASVDKFRRQFEYFADVSDLQRQEARRDRDYRDHKQWTESELEVLEARGQAPVVVNRIAPKIDYLVGVERSQKQDPKAWPRNPDDNDAAEAATDALRYVTDNVDFDMTSSDCFEDLLVEGIEGAIVEWINDEISVSRIPYDRIYYDAHSQKRFFEDCQYKGVVIWMDLETAKRMFPKKSEELEGLVSDDAIDTGFDDKPLWVDKERKRVKVCQHYYLEKGTWRVVYFSGDTELLPPTDSPYLDEDGKPVCPIELVYCYKDRDNDHYGWVRQFKWIQDEINHRRSKALNILSRRTVIADRGAVNDPYQTKEELTRADGYIEVTPGMRFDIDPGNDLAQGQLTMLQEAKSEIDSIAARTEVSTAASGRSRLLAGSNDMLEVGPLLNLHRKFKTRVYRQVWMRIKQFWDSERWVRVTDDEDNLKFVGLNVPKTFGQNLQEKAQQGDEQAAQDLQVLLMTQDPRLNQIENVENDVTTLDLDITLGEVQDVANIQQEQFEMITQLAQVYGPQSVPFEVVIQMSQLRNKREILDKLQGADNPELQQQQAMQQQIAMMQLQADMQKLQAEIAKLSADAQKSQAQTAQIMAETEHEQQKTIQTAVETQVIATQPSNNVSVST